MACEATRRRRAAVVIRWVARIWSIPVLLFVAVMFAGEVLFPHATPPTSARDVVGLALFPFGVCLGILLAWRWEGLGGIICLASFFGFYAALGLFNGRLPRGPSFALIAAPGFLSMASFLLRRSSQQQKNARPLA
ncbi:MAG: hypothetical protein JSU70_16215 [Phycisphaerales bacterium]|nr:MAG: hypothetical protein JSU70_16215 [Phycisphaerales bacterium]